MEVDYYDIFTRENIEIEVLPASYIAIIEVDRRLVEYDDKGELLEEDVVEEIASKLRRQHNIGCESWTDETRCGLGPRCLVISGHTEKIVARGIKLVEQELTANAALVLKAFLKIGLNDQKDE